MQQSNFITNAEVLDSAMSQMLNLYCQWSNCGGHWSYDKKGRWLFSKAALILRILANEELALHWGDKICFVKDLHLLSILQLSERNHSMEASIKQPHQTTEKLKPKTAKTSFGVTAEKDVFYI